MWKSKHVTFVILFLFGWLAGSIFTLLYLSTSGSYSQSLQFSFGSLLNPQSSTIRNHHNSTSKSIPNHNLTIQSHKLTNNLPINSFSSNYSFHDYTIYLDWPLDDKLFTYENYLALESLLVVYTNAQFRILLPTSKDMMQSKVGNLLSMNQFLKYRKLGYDIQAHAVDQMIQMRGPGYGTNYWNNWSQGCCQKCDGNCR